MNTYPHVILVNNPLKNLKITSKINSSTTIVKALVPESYLDLKTGIWNISLDYVIAKAPASTVPVKAIYDIKTALVTSLAFENGLTEFCFPKSQFTSLGQFELVMKDRSASNIFLFKKFTPQWYYIDQPSLDHFELQIIQNDFLPLTIQNNFEIELGLLFQRIH
jgi:hypothetical protein